VADCEISTYRWWSGATRRRAPETDVDFMLAQLKAVADARFGDEGWSYDG